MTTPGNPPLPPEGSFVVGSAYGSDLTEESAIAQMTGPTKLKYADVQTAIRTQIREPIDGAYDAIAVVEGHAGDAVDTATAAINAANTAVATAASALEAVGYWETEFVVASAAVVLGDNELLIGPCQNVPGGLERIITDLHIALLSQPNGLEFELKKWNPDGTADSVLGTYTLPAGNTRASFAIDYTVVHRERVFINFTSITGSIAPQVSQVLIFGAFVEETP